MLLLFLRLSHLKEVIVGEGDACILQLVPDVARHRLGLVDLEL